jgi:hypothetical protein
LKLKGLQTNHFITHLIEVLQEDYEGEERCSKKGSGAKATGGAGSSTCSNDDWTTTSGIVSVSIWNEI